MLREIISRCKTIKYCADNFTQDFGLDFNTNTKFFKLFYIILKKIRLLDNIKDNYIFLFIVFGLIYVLV